MARVSGSAFDHVLVIMFENQYRGYALQNPYLRRLARQGIQLGNYFGVMHPSQTNYIASIAGSLCNITSDGRPPLSAERTLVDLLEEAPGRLRWKAYMESYVAEATPWSPTFTPADAHPYYIKHNPFSSFASIVRSEPRWRCVQNEAALFADLLNGELPEFAWFTPNMWSDGHWVDGTEEESVPRAPALVDQLARWLEGFFHRLRFPGPQSRLPPRTLVVVTFDESDFEADYLPDQDSAYDGPNQVYTVLLGNHLEPGFEAEGYNHYSLLRTIEQNFGLGHLDRNDAGANWFQFLWGRRFAWGRAVETPLRGGGPLAAAGFSGALFVASATSDGQVDIRTYTQTDWSSPERLDVDGSGGLALASTFDTLLLVAHDGAGTLRAFTWRVGQGWSPPVELGTGDAVALQSFDKERRIMLAIRTGESVSTRIWTEAGFTDPVAVPAATSSGALALGTLGASLYLVVGGADATLNVVSYNTAPWNVVTVPPNKWGGPQDDTTVEAWAPCAVPVAHFSARPDNGLRQPVARAYTSGAPLVAGTLDGVIHLVHPGPRDGLLLTETFSISGMMTPSQPISYKSTDSATASNGFGTLAEAGWSHQEAMFGRRVDAGGALALGRLGDTLLLLHRATADARVRMTVGRYQSR